MPRFYFDTDDGERQFHDEVGIDLPSRDGVSSEAMDLLRDLAHVHLPVGRRVMKVELRDGANSPIYRVTMTVAGEIIA